MSIDVLTEGLELESKRAVVTLTGRRNVAGQPEWEILGRDLRTHRMYRAVVPVCACDRRACIRTHQEWDSNHGRHYCHSGAHLEHAVALVRRVLASYASTPHRVNLDSDRIECHRMIEDTYLPRDYSAHRPEHLAQWPDYLTLAACMASMEES